MTAPRRLGLDLALRTGYALADGRTIIKSGVRDFSVPSHKHQGHRGILFYNFLVSLGRVDEIYYESIMFGGGWKDKRTGKHINPSNDGRELYHGLLMVVNMFAAGNDIPVTPVHPGTLKKAFTGHGNAEKEDMCAAAHSLGWKGGKIGTALCHDEADAIGLVGMQIALQHGEVIRFP